jgi:hypothetical protein
MEPLDSSDRPRVRVLEAALFLSAIAWSFRLMSFLHAKEAVLALFLPLAAALALRKNASLRAGFRAWTPLWLGLCVTGFAGLCTAQVPARVVEEMSRLTVLLLFATLSFDLLRKPAIQARILKTIVLGAAAVAALGLLQYAGAAPGLFPKFAWYDQRIYSVFGNQDLFGGYLALAVPLVLHALLTRDRVPRFYVVFLPLLAAGLLLSGSRSAWLAACVGCLAILPWTASQRRRIVWIAPVVLVVAVATIAISSTPLLARVTGVFGPGDIGGRARLWFWDGTARMIRDARWLGVGLGNYGYWSPRYLAESLHAEGAPNAFHNELHALDAHCEPLHYLAETGFLGAAFAVWMATRLQARRSAVWGAFAASLVFACFNAGMHSAPHALAALLCMGMLMRDPKLSTKPQSSLPNRLTFAASSLVGGMLLWTVLVPSYLLRRAEDVHCAGQNPLAWYERALAHRWPDYDAREEYGQALFEAGRFDAARTQLQYAARGVDTGKVHLLQGMTSERLGDWKAARNAYEACLYRWPGNAAANQGIDRTKTLPQ